MPYTSPLRSTVIFLLSLFYLSTANAQRYYTTETALAYLFPNAEKITFEKKELTAGQLKKIQDALGTKDVRKQWTVYVALNQNKIQGYAIIDHVIGKELPITFIVSITPEGSVKEVEVMVYRESHGGAIKNKAFRQQFVGKSSADPLKVGKDIVKVSGATISAKNIAYGVRRALLVWQEFYCHPRHNAACK